MQTLLTPSSPMTFTPKAALIVYDNNQTSYIELRPILADGSMGAARGVSRKFLTDAFSSIHNDGNDTPGGFVPENVLFTENRPGRNVLAWYNPPCRRQRYFAKSLGLDDGQYSVPGTIYIVSDKTLYVFCYKGSERPDRSTMLLKGPFFNIYEDGHICTGNAKTTMPDYVAKTWTNIMRFWEDVFWKTIDAHTLGGSPSTKHNLIETIKKYQSKPFPAKEMNSYNITLESEINKILSK